MIVAFYLPALFLYVKGQRNKPLNFPYREVGTALLLAVAIAGINQLIPEYNHWLELVVAGLLTLLWIVLLAPLRAIPPQHWKPLVHMIRSFRRGTPASFRPRRGLRSLDPETRDALRLAVVGRLPREQLVPAAGPQGLMLVRALRQVGQEGEIPVGDETEHDADMAVFLFENASTAVRNASMRKLLAEGAESNDLRSMEDMVNTLARVPVEAWEDQPVKRRGHRGRRRRAAAELRARATRQAPG
jgi:hypothetical protein